MTLQDFKSQVRHSRGKLKSSDEHLDIIFKNGTEGLIEFTLFEKAIGVENISDIATLGHEEQGGFVAWYYSLSPRPKKEMIELYLADKLHKQPTLF